MPPKKTIKNGHLRRPFQGSVAVGRVREAEAHRVAPQIDGPSVDRASTERLAAWRCAPFLRRKKIGSHHDTKDAGGLYFFLHQQIKWMYIKYISKFVAAFHVMHPNTFFRVFRTEALSVHCSDFLGSNEREKYRYQINPNHVVLNGFVHQITISGS